jgi:hypothetical protein
MIKECKQKETARIAVNVHSVTLIKSPSPGILMCSVFNFEYLLSLLIKNAFYTHIRLAL